MLALPYIGMYYGLHEWTSRVTGGVVDARFIALTNTALESPLGQIAMIPMLAWIARCAPANLKATFFAVMASFTNLALSLAELGTKYLNQIYVVKREVKDPATGVIREAADYSQLGDLLIVQLVLSVVLPFAAIAIARLARLRTGLDLLIAQSANTRRRFALEKLRRAPDGAHGHAIDHVCHHALALTERKLGYIEAVCALLPVDDDDLPVPAMALEVDVGRVLPAHGVVVAEERVSASRLVGDGRTEGGDVEGGPGGENDRDGRRPAPRQPRAADDERERDERERNSDPQRVRKDQALRVFGDAKKRNHARP